jgi:hypothetical protein
MKKAISLISAVLLIGITISVIAIVYQAGMPIIEKMQASAATESIKSSFVELNERIQRVASETNGSRRTMSFRIEPGDLIVNDTEDVVYWILDTEAVIFSPRTASYYGNLIFGSNLETKAYEEDYSGTDCYVLENEHIKTYFKKLGSPSSLVGYSTHELLVAVYQKDLDKWLDASLEISVDDGSINGVGYTALERSGNALPYGKVSAYMSSSAEYYINFTLESGADFITIEGSQA